MNRRPTISASDRVLGHLGLFAMGVVAVAVARLETDARAGRASVAGRAARVAIAAMAFCGAIVDRLSDAPVDRGSLVGHRGGETG